MLNEGHHDDMNISILIKTCWSEIAKHDHTSSQKIKYSQLVLPDQLLYFVQITMGNLSCKTDDDDRNVNHQPVTKADLSPISIISSME